MRLRLRAPISTAIAIATGLIVLLGYFVDFELFVTLRRVFLRWAVILAAVAFLVGLANLISVHYRRLSTRQTGSINSLILMISLMVTLLVTGFFGPTDPWSMWIFNYIQVPLETSLMAVLAVVLAYASVRMLRRRVNLLSVVFVATVVFVLVGTATLPMMNVSGLRYFRDWVTQVPAVAGARGILLGVALGTVATGLRVLLGADRPYGG